jgi:hypothetical protein
MSTFKQIVEGNNKNQPRRGKNIEFIPVLGALPMQNSNRPSEIIKEIVLHDIHNRGSQKIQDPILVYIYITTGKDVMSSLLE